MVTIVVLDERSLWEIWSWEFELGGQRAAGSGQGGRGGGRRRRERWRPFFPLGCYCLPISLSLFVTAARILRCRICESVSLRWPVLVPQALATFLSFQGASIKKRGRKEGGKTLLAGCLVFHHKSSPPSHWKATLTSEHKRQIALVPSRLGFLVNS